MNSSYINNNISSNNTNFTSSVGNATNHSCPANSSSAFNKWSIALNIISPALSTIFGDFGHQILLKCCNNDRRKYVRHRSESKIRNIGCNWECFLSSKWITLFTGLCTIATITNGWTGLSISLVPPMVFAILRFGTNIFYAALYNSDWQCNSDIKHLKRINDNNYVQHILRRGITMDEITRERKFLFESLINRGKIDKLLEQNFSFTQMLRDGVQPGVLCSIIPQLQPTQVIKLQVAIVEKDNVAQHWQDPEVQAALQAVLLVVLRTIVEQPNVLQNTIAQQNTLQLAALQAALQNANAQYNAAQQVQGAITQHVQNQMQYKIHYKMH